MTTNPRAPMTLSSILSGLQGEKTASAPTPGTRTPSTAADAERTVAEKCAALLEADATKTASASSATGTSLVRDKVAALADASMEAEVQRQHILGAAYVDGAMHRYASYVPILEQGGLMKSAAEDLPFEKFAAEYPTICKTAEQLGYEQQRNEIAALFAHGQRISTERVAALSIANGSSLFLQGFEDLDRVMA